MRHRPGTQPPGPQVGMRPVYIYGCEGWLWKAGFAASLTARSSPIMTAEQRERYKQAEAAEKRKQQEIRARHETDTLYGLSLIHI